MRIYEKIKLIRQCEQLNQQEFSDLTGISISTIKKLDSGVKKDLKVDTLLKVTSAERFTKYALWLVTDKDCPEVGQIVPSPPESAK